MAILSYCIGSKLFEVDTKDYDDGVHTLPNKDSIWVKNGKLHCDDGPARISHTYGSKEWWFDDKRHREDGPAYEASWGKEWWFNGLMHREDGPVYERSYCKIWACMGKVHRLDGPAFIGADGEQRWWIDDVEYTLEEFELAVATLEKQ